MRLLRIELSNYRQYQQAEIHFPQQGLIGIRGDNGTGKSTIFNAMDWVLYGKYKGKVTQSQLRTFEVNSKSPTFGIVDFIYQDNFYRVRRDLINSNIKNFVQKNGHSVAAGTTNMNDYILDLFKMDQESFRTCYYASQDDFDSLAKLNSAPRVQMISKLLRLETIDYAAEKARKDKKVLEIEIDEAKRHLRNEEDLLQQIHQADEDKKNVEKQIVLVENELMENEQKRNALFESKKESDENFEKYQAISSKISNLETKKQTLQEHSLQTSLRQLQVLEEKKERLTEIGHLKDHYFRLLQKKDELNESKEQFVAVHRLEKEKVELINTLEFHSKALEEATTQLATFTAIESKTKELEHTITMKETEISSMRDTVQELSTALAVKKTKYQEIMQEIIGFQQLGADIPCPTCKRPLGEHQEDHLGSLENAKNEIIQQTAKLKNEYDRISLIGNNLKQEIYSLKEELRIEIQKIAQKSGFLAKKENHTSELNKNNQRVKELEQQRAEFPTTIDFDVEQYKVLLEEIKSLQPFYEEILQLENTVKDIPGVRTQIEQINQQITDLIVQLDLVQKELESLGFDKDKHLSLSTQMETLHKTIDSLKENRYTFQSRKDIIANNIQTITTAIEENKEKRDALKEKQDTIIKLTKLDQLFKTYKTDKLAKLSPTLSDMMSDMMDLITDGRYDRVELDDQYNIFIHRDGKPQPLDIFSGGEQKLAALCQRIAISQLLVSQTGQASFDMIALDEVFGSQDAKRQDAMIDMFRNLNDMFPQILIVSHSENVKDMFDHTLHIELDGKVSKAKWIKDEYGNDTWNEEEVRGYVLKNYNLLDLDSSEEVVS